MNFIGSSGSSSSSMSKAGFYDDKEREQGSNLVPRSTSFPTSSSYHQHDHLHHQQQHQQLDLLPMDTSTNHNYNLVDEDDEKKEESSRSGGGGDQGMDGERGMIVVEREHMFDKVVTPSDVGKLNRLVIPKQHAERYFPLDSSSNEKGLLLNFEDRKGKPWRFRYSYWNSSQSYVMTKGWSRFVKEKKLDAGDIVSFERGVGEMYRDRLFIDWRRRPDAPSSELFTSVLPNLSFPHPYLYRSNMNMNMNLNIHPWNPLLLHPQALPSQPLQTRSNMLLHSLGNNSYCYGGRGGGGGGPLYLSGPNNSSLGNQCSASSIIYLRSEAGAPQQQQQRAGGGIGMGMGMDPPPPLVFESVPVVHGKAAAKRLRLFGVNMDCPISNEDDEPPSDEFQMIPTPSSATTSHQSFANDIPASSSSSIPYLQLRPYNGPSAVSSSDFLSKSKGSTSLDMDI